MVDGLRRELSRTASEAGYVVLCYKLAIDTASVVSIFIYKEAMVFVGGTAEYSYSQSLINKGSKGEICRQEK